MKKLIWIIGGTSEARALIESLADLNINIYVSVATEYGAELIVPQENVIVMAERMALEKMREFLVAQRPDCVVDATHPYATIVTETVKKACALENTKYLRMLRAESDTESCVRVNNFNEAVDLLNKQEGNIFLTTGSKNLKDFVNVKNFKERIALRILPMEDSLKTALKLGYKPSNIICMQGPFSKELNIAMMKSFNSKFMITKDSGNGGGVNEKIEAAAAVGATLIVIGRASEESGLSYDEVRDCLRTEYGHDR